MSGRALRDTPTRFVARDEREQVFVAFAELVSRQGYDDVDAEAVADAAGISPATFHEWFDSVDDCMLGALEATADQAFVVAADAFVRTPGDWAEAVHAMLAELLDFLAASPELTRICTVDALEAGAVALERLDELISRFTDFLEPGYAAAEPPPPAITSEAISGGMFELIRGYATGGRIDALPEALPTATVIALSPFVGSDDAERIAQRPPPARGAG